MPVHNGHLFVCDVAARFVDELTVFVCSHDAEPIDGFLRAEWMRECLNGTNCNVVHMHRDIPQTPDDHPDFWRIWTDTITEHHPKPIDYVFGSEEYIYPLAQALDAKPFIVDLERQTVPVSGTVIRSDAGQNWGHIPAPVRRHLQKRLTLIGPESTGKSTLAKVLGDQFATKTVPEFGRFYDAAFKQGANWEEQDFMTIADGHAAQASAIAPHAGPVVIEDTDLLQTVVWSEALLEVVPDVLVSRLKTVKRPDLYLLLSPQMAWVDDGTRYHASLEERRWFHARLKHWLGAVGASWVEIADTTWLARQHHAAQAVSDLLDGDFYSRFADHTPIAE